MQKKLIYDLPTRIMHWSFALLFIVAFCIAKIVDDENPLFSYHMLAGLMLGGMVVLRLIWGLVGSKYARFSSFALYPQDLIHYIKGILVGDKKRWSGHNPASSWATLAMLFFALMLAITGILMTSGHKETYEDVHELFANGFLVTVVFHILGLVLHTLKYRDDLAMSMVHGKKELNEKQDGISGQKPVAAFFLLLLMGIWGFYLFKSFNNATQELNLFGRSLSLGENEIENEEHNDDDR
jgi:cytochrome b